MSARLEAPTDDVELSSSYQDRLWYPGGANHEETTCLTCYMVMVYLPWMHLFIVFPVLFNPCINMEHDIASMPSCQRAPTSHIALVIPELSLLPQHNSSRENIYWYSNYPGLAGYCNWWGKDAATVFKNTRSCTPCFPHTGGWRKLSASNEFLNFENRTIIKGDMAKNVSEDKI